jgi:DNA-binding response OmpR family regulator
MAKKILIVEDEKALASVLSLKLKGAGYETTVLYNGDDALAAITAGGLDLALIDIMMPKRDGFSVLEELKKAGNKTPIFIMSNLGQQEDIDRIKAYGVKDYIVKADASPQEILDHVRTFLG